MLVTFAERISAIALRRRTWIAQAILALQVG
jgi:hypothetical protein